MFDRGVGTPLAAVPRPQGMTSREPPPKARVQTVARGTPSHLLLPVRFRRRGERSLGIPDGRCRARGRRGNAARLVEFRVPRIELIRAIVPC